MTPFALIDLRIENGKQATQIIVLIVILETVRRKMMTLKISEN